MAPFVIHQALGNEEIGVNPPPQHYHWMVPAVGGMVPSGGASSASFPRWYDHPLGSLVLSARFFIVVYSP